MRMDISMDRGTERAQMMRRARAMHDTVTRAAEGHGLDALLDDWMQDTGRTMVTRDLDDRYVSARFEEAGVPLLYLDTGERAVVCGNIRIPLDEGLCRRIDAVMEYSLG